MKYLQLFEAYTGILPTRILKKVYHVGEMDKSKKADLSYEGSGLSVSLHPKEWSKIARLGGEVHTLTKDNGTFVDFHKLKENQKQGIIEWGFQNELVTESDVYRYTFYDDDDEECYMDFDSFEQAMYEADDDEESITVIEGGIKATEKLIRLSEQKSIGLSETFSHLATVYIEKETDYDGVWWNDVLDVHNYSAPRGVIFIHKIKLWNIQ
jgi:hypothetical protein